MGPKNPAQSPTLATASRTTQRVGGTTVGSASAAGTAVGLGGAVSA
jgi:hypothetical protein